MIPKISPNFTGIVRIGHNAYERRDMNSALEEVPESKRKDFVKSTIALQDSITKNTPDNSNYLICVAGYNNGYIAGTSISVTDTDLNKCIALDSVLKTLDGEPVPPDEYTKNMESAFQKIESDTIDKSKNRLPNKRAFFDELA